MSVDLVALCIDASRPRQLAAFWSTVLNRTVVDDDGPLLTATDDQPLAIRFTPNPEPKTVTNRMHFDLTSDSLPHQTRLVDTALTLGAHHLDVGQGPDAEHVVLADPENNEFCIIEPGNRFLAGCGPVGALAGEGLPATGYFWSQALGWPLVWDQDDETAIQSPRGGTKISWGGPPVPVKAGRNRLRFELALARGSDLTTEIDRLLALGATRLDAPPSLPDRAEIADPEGNEFSLVDRRPS